MRSLSEIAPYPGGVALDTHPAKTYLACTMNSRVFRRCSFLSCLWLLVSSFVPTHAAQFTLARQFLRFAGPIAVADFDGDGRPDFVAAGPTINGSMTNALFRNTGELTFARQPVTVPEIIYGVTLIADVDGDGAPDLIRGGWINGLGYQTQVLRNNAGNLEAKDELIPGQTVAVADLDNDGNPDLVTVDFSERGARVWWNDGHGHFTLADFELGTRAGDVAAVDLDADGDTDLLVKGWQGSVTSWFRNDGEGHFADTGLTLPVVPPSMASWADYDGDGRLDVLQGARIVEGQANWILTARVLLQADGFQFNPAFAAPTTLAGTRAILADLDNEGRPDAFLVGADTSNGGQALSPGSRVLLRGDGLALAPPIYLPTTSNDSAGAVADFDGDRDLDLLVGATDDSAGETWAVRVYRNTIGARLAAPLPPRNLRSVVGATTAVLAWDRAPESRVAGTSHHLRVGTRPGGQDVVSAMTLDDGQPRVPGPGNQAIALQRRLRRLAPGTYYWSVQTVSAAFVASVPAPEESFTITGNPTDLAPTIAPIGPQVTHEDTATAPVTFTIDDAETAPTALTVDASSSDPDLVPLTGFTFTGTGRERRLTIQPAPDRSGVAWITLTVTDGAGQSAHTTFPLTVLPVNDPPRLAPIPNQTLYLGGPAVSLPLDYSDPESLRGELQLEVRAADERLLPRANVTIVMNPPGPTLVLVPPTNQVGSTTVELSVSDGTATTRRSFVVTVEPLPFTAESTGLVVAGTPYLSVADVDNDDDLDLLVASLDVRVSGQGSLVILRNDGRGGFTDGPVTTLPKLTQVRAAWADFDRDGDVDLALCGWGTNQPVTLILRNDGAGGFTDSRIVMPGVYNGSIEWVDFNGDGLPDLLLAGMGLQAPLVRVLRNDGAGHFTNVPLPVPGMTVLSAAAADIDGDGRVDFVVSGNTTTGQASTRFYRNTGEGFTLRDGGVATAANVLGWRDLDGNGAPDLWMLPVTSSGRVQTMTLNVLANDGAGGLLPVFSRPGLSSGGVWGDFDADGAADFLAFGETNEAPIWFPGGSAAPNPARLLRNAGGFSFEDGGAVLGTNGLSSAVAADFDGDGRLDVVGTLANGRLSEIVPITITQPLVQFRHKVGVVNPLPGAPTGLRAEVNGIGVTLSWDPAVDANQARGHTYNVRLGTTPGGRDALSPAAGANGFVRVPGPGNAGGRTTLTLAALPGETYYWSVQAVDELFDGGAFAPEATFAVAQPGNQPPAFGPMDGQTTREDTPFEFTVPVTDDRTPTARLVVEAYSLDPLLLPFAGIGVRWDGTSWVVQVAPATGLTGSADVVVLATDATGQTASAHVAVEVLPVNDSPTITLIADVEVAPAHPSEPVAFGIVDAETPADKLGLRVESSDAAVVDPADVVFGGSGTNRTLVVTARGSAPAEATLTVTVSDPEGATASTTFRVVVKERTFTPVANPFAGFRGDMVAWADYDGDGRLDLLIAGDAGAAMTRLYHNDGNGHFSDSGIKLASVRGGAAVWGDFDNDGDPDLLLTGSWDTSGLHVYRNDGAAGFTRLDLATSGYNWTSAAWGDYDNDGRLDFVVAGEYPNNTVYAPVARLYHNDGGGHFSPVNLALPTRDGPVAWADFDGDGWVDLLLGGTDREMLHFVAGVLRNEGGRSFTDRIAATALGVRLGSQPADMDGDGRVDLVLNQHSPTSTYIARNLPDGTFQPWLEPLPLNGTVAVGDADDDGRPDVFIAGYGHDFNVGLTNGTHLFVATPQGGFNIADVGFPRFEIAGASAWGDADGDGDLDLLVVGQREGGIYSAQLYRNNGTNTNQPPTAPTGLVAILEGDVVRLSWDAATDPDQTNALSYSVRIGTTPGGSDVLSALARTDGRRLVAAAGNAGFNRFKVLQSLAPDQRCYWSVQAVDAAFLGSPFSAEASFVTARPPTLTPIADQTIREDESTPALALTIGDPVTPVDQLELTARADDPSLVPDANLVFSGTGADRTLVITPAPDAHGTTFITVTVRNPAGNRVAQRFVLAVLPVNDPPVAPSQTVSVNEDETVAFRLGATDADGDALTFLIVRPPRHGRLEGTAPELVYRPEPDYFGEDSFLYQADDGRARSALAEVRLVIAPVVDQPDPRLEAHVDAEGAVWLDLLGEPRQRYRIEGSSDLRTWLPALELEGASGSVRLRDLGAVGMPMRFYRLVPAE